ncbi:LOW QUALITY PROTEIN: importin subunit alpha-9 [Brassica napus]|uniref:LOW QUALITY PROTEIN: importin subunit alpha-9 n=1 Tax=Brassica napus TaxID=3708 RepID=UPI00207913AD|nr:LOW QUALITY PROTEIN: importin subunit alpha-9 [Brassica napus]
MLAKLQNAERLSFGGSLFQILSLAELRGVSFPTFKVQTLTLKTRFAKSFVPGITRLLHNSPGLKKLIVDWYLDNYLNSQGLNPDQCWRSKYDVFPTSDESDMIGPESKAAAQLVRVDGIVDVILRHLKKSDEEIAMEIAWIIVYLSALSDIATRMLLKGGILQLLVERLATSDSLQLLIPVLRSLGNFVSVDPKAMLTILIGGKNTEESVIGVLAKCLRSDHRVLKKEAAWVLSNIAAGSIEHKRMIHSTEAMPLLIELLSTSPFDIRKEVAYVLGNLCVESAEGDTKPRIIQEHLVSIVSGGCLPGFINLVRSPDIEAARLGLQFIELVLRGMPNGEGSKIVEGEDGIDAMQRFQFHENEELRVMANSLVDKYFGEDYGINE